MDSTSCWKRFKPLSRVPGSMNKEQRQYTIEAHFFIENDFLDVADLLRELREDIAHGLNKDGHQLAEETRLALENLDLVREGEKRVPADHSERLFSKYDEGRNLDQSWKEWHHR